jgi:hypothetical protein
VTNRLMLSDFLGTRIMRYPMLFQRVLEHMPQDHPHRPKVLLALDIVDKVSREVGTSLGARLARYVASHRWRGC